MRLKACDPAALMAGRVTPLEREAAVRVAERSMVKGRYCKMMLFLQEFWHCVSLAFVAFERSYVSLVSMCNSVPTCGKCILETDERFTD